MKAQIIEVIRICIYCKRPVKKQIKIGSDITLIQLEAFKKAQTAGVVKYTICSDCWAGGKR